MDHDTIDVVRDVIAALREEEVPSFTARTLCDRDERLAMIPLKKVDQLLMRLQQDGDCIYPEAMGTDGTHLWSFSRRGVPSPRRRPIGRR